MKTRYSIIIICLLALFATGCKKDNNGHIRIFAEKMKSDSKILIHPDHLDEASWVVGETISINGTPYSIYEDDDNGGFCLNGVTESGAMLAIYPGNSFGNNDIEVNSNEVVLKRLTVHIRDYYYNEDYRWGEVVFPMSATAAAGSDQLLFNHLTGGLIVTLVNGTYSNIDIASIKIVAQSNNEIQNLNANNVTARWAVQGPALPHGEVGEEVNDYCAKNVSEMNFDFMTTQEVWDYSIYEYVLTTTSGATIGESNDLTFCVPITINSLRYLTITGYSANGTQMFHVTKDLGAEQTISASTMYTLPSITIESDSGMGSGDDMN